MPLPLAALLLGVLALCAYAAWRGRIKKCAQALVYAEAERRARATGKPLVVVGDPAAPQTLNFIFGAGNGCGDLCVDVAGAPGCPRSAALPVLAWLRAQPPDSAVIFESEVLIYVPPAELAPTIDELFRVSGGDLFSVHSNAIDSLAYAASGLPPRPRLWLAPSRFLTFDPAFLRAFVAYPPHDRYAWIELGQSGGSLAVRRYGPTPAATKNLPA